MLKMRSPDVCSMLMMIFSALKLAYFEPKLR